MTSLSLTSDGLFVNGRRIELPMSKGDMLALFGQPGAPDVRMHGTRWPFASVSLIAGEATTAPEDPERPIEALYFVFPSFNGSFTIDGIPWNQVTFEETLYGKELRVGRWIVAPSDNDWSLYVSDEDPKPKPGKKSGKKQAAKKSPKLKTTTKEQGGKSATKVSDPFGAVEATFGVSLPDLFRTVWANRGFDAAEWGKRRKTALLFADLDFAPIRPRQILDAHRELREAFEVDVDAHRLVPFARTEQGDHYCFHFDGSKGANVPVVYIPTDEDEGRYVAKNLADFLFRRTLEVVGASTEEERGNAERMVAAVRPYVTTARARVLEEFAARPKLPAPTREISRLLKLHIAFPKLGKKLHVRG